ncbi:hypothetical protein CC80DRAFT_597192 [Byssothecium circinans]|uniref:Uncharacterized protein n=1 Tax=Byssothecium circinans TaxID=147558 RepID=A0A6A5TFY6_9PLEO|nr:hypothetical protein CC80DRAFT_597192 [Byssothecium circinans]
MSGATTAFVYAMLFSSDFMESTFTALKDAGVKCIVLLFRLRRASLSLRASRIAYVALRPVYFNTNLVQQMRGYEIGSVNMYGVSAYHDFIAPNDIGAVAGALQVSPAPPQPDNAIPLNGSKVMDIYWGGAGEGGRGCGDWI